MSSHAFLFQDAYFGTPEQLGNAIDSQVFWDFLKHLQRSSKTQRYLRSFSRMYLLILTTNSEILLKEGEDTFDQLLDDTASKKLAKYGAFVAGYLLPTEDHLVSFIDTRVRGYNLAELMMNRYASMHEMDPILPQEIIPSTVGYWRKYLDNYHEVETQEEIRTLMQECGKDLYWDPLFETN